MAKIKIVMVKHRGCDKKYIFAAPAYMIVERGDALLVDTIRGRQYAVAVTNEIEICPEDVEMLGAYLPLKYVQERASKELLRAILADKAAQEQYKIMTNCHIEECDPDV